MIFNRFISNVIKSPKKVALVFDNKMVTYEALAHYCLCLAELLIEKGVKPGDLVLVELENSIDFVVLLMASAYLKLILLPISIHLPTTILKNIFQKFDIKFVVSTKKRIGQHLKNKKVCLSSLEDNNYLTFGHDGELSKIYSQFYQEKFDFNHYTQTVDDVDVPFILTMTSGSTGDPKPILLSQKTKINRALIGMKDLYQLREDEIILVSSPMYHSLAQRLVILPLISGYTAIILKQFSVDGWFDYVHKYKVSFCIMVSSHLERLIEKIKGQEEKLASLENLIASSSPLSIAAKSSLEKVGCQVHECYGTSEVGIVTTLNIISENNKIKSVGKALNYVDLKIVNKKGEVVNQGEVGEIICKSKTAFQGYYINGELEKFTADDDYFYTGDLGWIDPDGYLYLAGRSKDVIKVSGISVYAIDVENVIKQVKFIEEVAVIGEPDSRFGECITAFFTIKHGMTCDMRTIKQICFDNLANYQQPQRFVVVDGLPKNAVGKIVKQKLRERCLDE